MIFKKYFYRLLLAINSNVDFIINSIDYRYNMDNKTFMQSSGINILIGAYWQLTAMLILLQVHSVDFQYNMDNKTFTQNSGIYIYRCLLAINSNVDSCIV